MSLIAIITPSYNREKLINNLYESLKKQSSKNFKWYVIDDGSIDKTKNVVNNFINEKVIDIEYIYKENGGKHTALNEAMKYVNEELSFIVDSDDELTSDAVETIEKDYINIRDEKTICGIGYLRLYKNKKTIGKLYTKDGIIDTFINQRYNKNVYGDKSEVYKTEILRKYPFPVFKGERFLSEAVVWCHMSLDYKMIFYNKGIYICEYQEGGLSDGVQKTMFNNPNGAVECYLKMSTKPFNLKNKLKYTIAYIMYSFAAKIKAKKQFQRTNSKFLYIMLFLPSYIMYVKRKRKYKK